MMTSFNDNDYIAKIDFDEKTAVRRRSEVEKERHIAINDLLEEGILQIEGENAGPYNILFEVINRGQKIRLSIKNKKNEEISFVIISTLIFRRITKDYFYICESYYDAIKNLPPHKIETIDMARRGLHNEGAVMIKEILEVKIKIDHNTARRLFTLICVLQVRG